MGSSMQNKKSSAFISFRIAGDLGEVERSQVMLLDGS